MRDDSQEVELGSFGKKESRQWIASEIPELPTLVDSFDTTLRWFAYRSFVARKRCSMGGEYTRLDRLFCILGILLMSGVLLLGWWSGISYLVDLLLDRFLYSWMRHLFNHLSFRTPDPAAYEVSFPLFVIFLSLIGTCCASIFWARKSSSRLLHYLSLLVKLGMYSAVILFFCEILMIRPTCAIAWSWKVQDFCKNEHNTIWSILSLVFAFFSLALSIGLGFLGVFGNYFVTLFYQHAPLSLALKATSVTATNLLLADPTYLDRTIRSSALDSRLVKIFKHPARPADLVLVGFQRLTLGQMLKSCICNTVCMTEFDALYAGCVAARTGEPSGIGQWLDLTEGGESLFCENWQNGLPTPPYTAFARAGGTAFEAVTVPFATLRGGTLANGYPWVWSSSKKYSTSLHRRFDQSRTFLNDDRVLFPFEQETPDPASAQLTPTPFLELTGDQRSCVLVLCPSSWSLFESVISSGNLISIIGLPTLILQCGDPFCDGSDSRTRLFVLINEVVSKIVHELNITSIHLVALEDTAESAVLWMSKLSLKKQFQLLSVSYILPTQQTSLGKLFQAVPQSEVPTLLNLYLMGRVASTPPLCSCARRYWEISDVLSHRLEASSGMDELNEGFISILDVTSLLESSHISSQLAVKCPNLALRLEQVLNLFFPPSASSSPEFSKNAKRLLESSSLSQDLRSVLTTTHFEQLECERNRFLRRTPQGIWIFTRGRL